MKNLDEKYVKSLIKELYQKNYTETYYKFTISDEIVGQLDIQVRMLFRAFKPSLLQEEHPDLLENLPIFEMVSIRDTVYIQSPQ